MKKLSPDILSLRSKNEDTHIITVALFHVKLALALVLTDMSCCRIM